MIALIPPGEKANIQRADDIRSIMAMIGKETKSSKLFTDVKVDESTFRIDLGDVVRFDSGDSAIKANAASFLRSYIPVLLEAQSSREGKKWMRRVVVEGFTDRDGTYLYNLGLSLNRSRSVVCVLFARPSVDEAPLSNDQKRQIRDIFLVGGYSFNSTRKEKSESRRVELQIEFGATPEDDSGKTPNAVNEFGQC